MATPLMLYLSDGTAWPDPRATGQFSERDMASAYRSLVTHPWGANVSCQKVRMLRREFARRALLARLGEEKGR